MEIHMNNKTVRARLYLPVGRRVCAWNGGGQAHDRRKREESGGYHDKKRRTVCVL